MPALNGESVGEGSASGSVAVFGHCRRVRSSNGRRDRRRMRRVLVRSPLVKIDIIRRRFDHLLLECREALERLDARHSAAKTAPARA